MLVWHLYLFSTFVGLLSRFRIWVAKIFSDPIFVLSFCLCCFMAKKKKKEKLFAVAVVGVGCGVFERLYR